MNTTQDTADTIELSPSEVHRIKHESHHNGGSPNLQQPVGSNSAVPQLPNNDHDSTPLLNLDEVRVDPAWALRIPAALAMRKHVLPLCRLGEVVQVACLDADDEPTRRQLEKLLGHDIEFVESDAASLRRALKTTYANGSGATPAKPRASAAETDSDDAVATCDQFLQAAVMRNASDIHLLPSEKHLRVLLRVDGQLEQLTEISVESQNAVLSRIKVQSGLDIAEKRSPQDGRFSLPLGDQKRKLDVRVATLPTRHGERITLRLLAGQTSGIDLAAIGMNETDLEGFRKAILRPHGMVLLTGPTGSGKSTTLYAAIGEVLKSRGGNVITVEDPIEYEMPGVSQVEIDSADKVNFDKALRSILRHDPDVLMIGEIRDLETAEIAVKASLTGHLVFSTLHTNTAAGVVTRLADMGLQRFLIAATLRMAIAQRLVRRLCSHCRQPRPLGENEAAAINRPELASETVYDAAGCVYCAGRGYVGRVALIERFECDPTVAKLITEDADEDTLAADGKRCGSTVLVDDAAAKMLDGTTTLEEVVKAVVAW